MADLNKYLIREEDLGLEPDTQKLLQYSKGLETPDIEQLDSVKKLRAEQEAMKGEAKQAYSEAARAKLIENMMAGIIKAYAAYRGMKSGEDMSKVEIQPSGIPELELKGKLTDIEERRQGAREGIQIAREDLSSRIRGAMQERDFKAGEQGNAWARMFQDMRLKQDALDRAERKSQEKAVKFNVVTDELKGMDKQLNSEIQSIQDNIGLIDTKAKAGTSTALKVAEARGKMASLLNMPEESLVALSPIDRKLKVDKAIADIENRRTAINSLQQIVGNAQMANKPLSPEEQAVYLKTLNLAQSSGGGHQLTKELPTGSIGQRVEYTLEQFKKDPNIQKVIKDNVKKYEGYKEGSFFGADDFAELIGRIDNVNISEDEFKLIPVELRSRIKDIKVENGSVRAKVPVKGGTWTEKLIPLNDYINNNSANIVYGAK